MSNRFNHIQPPNQFKYREGRTVLNNNMISSVIIEFILVKIYFEICIIIHIACM